MDKSFFSLQSAKPLLLASAIALALTACGGSGSGNAPTPDQPSTPQAPDSNKTPQTNPQQPQGNGGQSGGHSGGSHNGGATPPPPQNPNPNPNPNPVPPAPQMPELKDPGNVIDTSNPGRDRIQGTGVFARSLNFGVPIPAGTRKELFGNILNQGGFIAKTEGNAITFSKKFIDLFEDGLVANEELRLELGENKTAEITTQPDAQGKNRTFKAQYHGKKFGYQDVQALHFYGLFATQPLSMAYTVGKVAQPQAVLDLAAAPGSDTIKYQGVASFRAHAPKTANELQSGEATVILTPATKKLDAIIDLKAAIDKTYEFKNVDYQAAPASPFEPQFQQGGKDDAQGIHGYFYGDKAQHIGGTYFVPEGSGAFVTEKQ
ncbi:MAG: hypothetical protein Q4D61_02300 [Cardiobacteriaceae bacterium]|nr:hypothetical protein [Cardiobacteriaceae bacterium]